jgi:hypothetical protein
LRFRCFCLATPSDHRRWRTSQQAKAVLDLRLVTDDDAAEDDSRGWASCAAPSGGAWRRPGRTEAARCRQVVAVLRLPGSDASREPDGSLGAESSRGSAPFSVLMSRVTAPAFGQPLVNPAASRDSRRWCKRH